MRGSEMRCVTYQASGGSQPGERRAVADTLGNQDACHSQPGQEVTTETRIREKMQRLK